MLSFLKTLSAEVARKGITANTIAPGYVDTDMMAAYPEQKAAAEKQIPLKRFARPDEIAALVSFLACLMKLDISLAMSFQSMAGFQPQRQLGASER